MALAKQAARQSGLASARIAQVEHPIGGVSPDLLGARADGVVDEVVSLLLAVV